MRATRFALAAIVLASSFPAATRDRGPYAGGRQCIAMRPIHAETAETQDRLILHVDGGRAYVSHLPAPCDGLLGLNNVSRLRLPETDRLCAGDTIALEGDGLLLAIGIGGDDRAPARCTLGRFEPITEMSLTEAIRR